MNEAETRAEHIEPALQRTGWGVVDGSRVLLFIVLDLCTHLPECGPWARLP